MTIYVKRKNVKFLSQIWTQKFRYYCLFRELFEIFMGLCRNILHKKGVLASTSHREDMKTCENNLVTILSEKKNFIFLMIFELRNFEEMSFYIPPKWISSNFKVV